jgi:hypothetical protein
MVNTVKTDLAATFTELLDNLSPLSEQQMNQIPFEGSWTAGQVGHHLLRSYGVGQVIGGRTMPTERPVDEKAAIIGSVFLDFSHKLKSPDFILPSTGHIYKEKLLQGLQSRMNETIAIAGQKDLSLTCTDFEIPGMGAMTGYEWLYFMYCHTQRHIHQLKNIVQTLNTRVAL